MNTPHDEREDAGGSEIDPTTFRAHLNTTFLITTDFAPVALRLVEVVEEPVSGGMRQFSIYFHGPPDRVLPQGTYMLRHRTLGVLDLFIVPVVGSNSERIVYQACFSGPPE
jgi:hypothetical protein